MQQLRKQIHISSFPMRRYLVCENGLKICILIFFHRLLLHFFLTSLSFSHYFHIVQGSISSTLSKGTKCRSIGAILTKLQGKTSQLNGIKKQTLERYYEVSPPDCLARTFQGSLFSCIRANMITPMNYGIDIRTNKHHVNAIFRTGALLQMLGHKRLHT